MPRSGQRRVPLSAAFRSATEPTHAAATTAGHHTRMVLAFSLPVGAFATVAIALVAFTAFAWLAIVMVPSTLAFLSGRSLWHRTPPRARTWLLHPVSTAHTSVLNRRIESHGLPDRWWQRFERDFRAYAIADARRRSAHRDRRNQR